MKKQLPNVDIVSINCVDGYASATAINYLPKRYLTLVRAILITHQDKDAYDMVCRIAYTRQIRLGWI